MKFCAYVPPTVYDALKNIYARWSVYDGLKTLVHHDGLKTFLCKSSRVSFELLSLCWRSVQEYPSSKSFFLPTIFSNSSTILYKSFVRTFAPQEVDKLNKFKREY